MLKLTVFILITLSCHSTSHSSFQQVNPQCQPNEPTSDTCTDDVNRLGLTRGAFVSLPSDDTASARLIITIGKLLPLTPRVYINNTVANALPIIPRSRTSNDLLHLKGPAFTNAVNSTFPVISRSTATPIQIDHSTPPQDSALPIMTTSHSSFQKVNPQCQPNEPISDTCTDDVNRLGLTRGAFVDKLLPLAPRVCINNTVANALPIISRSTATPIQIDHSTPPQVDSALSIMTTSHSSFQKVNPQCQPNEPTSDTCTDDVNRLGLTRGAFVSLPSDDTASARLIITIGKLLPLTPRVYINNTVAN
eukprot:680623_1